MTVTRAHVSGREVISGEAPTPTNGVAQGETPPARVSLDAGVTYTVGAHGEARREDRSSSLNVADLKPTKAGILATARSAAGRLLSVVELTPRTVVTLPDGRETMLRVAELEGLVTRGPNGEYKEVEQTDAPQEDTEADKPQPFTDQQAERLLDESVRLVPPQMQDQLVHKVLTGKLDERTLHDVAAASGMTRDELVQRVVAIDAAFKTQAATAAERAGVVDYNAWVAWVQENYPREWQDAARQHIYARSTKGYTKLFDRYLRSTSPSAEEIESATGLKVQRGARGVELITINGVQMTVSEAARQGLL